MSTNKNKQKALASSSQNPNKGPTTKKPSPFAFANTECKLNLPVTEEQLFETLKGYINGIAFRQETNFLEVTLKEPTRTKTLLTEGITIEDKLIIPLPPKEVAPRTLRIKLANVPLHVPRKKLEADITNHWAQFTSVKTLAPYTYKGTEILTRRWDLIVQIPPEDNALKAPVTWEYEGTTVLANWRGAPPSCLSCKSAGHFSNICPTFPPKKTMAETLKKSIDSSTNKTPKF
ncbi:10460_t:CDS:2, partial [Paraglomus occultum]